MKKSLKILSLVLAVCMLIGAFPVFAESTTSVVSASQKTAAKDVTVDGVTYNAEMTKIINVDYEKSGAYKMPDSVTTVGVGAFKYCENITSVEMSKNVTDIMYTAFYGCKSLKSLTLPDKLKSVDSYAFCDIGVKSLNIPKGVSFGYSVFAICENLETVTVENGVTSIENDMFKECKSLKSVTTSASLKEIKSEAFVDCSALETVTLEKSVSKIGDWAFSGCGNLKTVYYAGSEADRKKISVGFDNDSLLNAKWVYNYVHPHKGGTATCAKKAVCILCGKEYGSLKAHIYKTVTTKASLTKNGKIQTKCTGCGKVTKTTTIYYPKTIKLSATSYKYDGKVKNPTVSVKDSKNKTVSSKNYTVSYAKGRKSIGSYKVTVKFKGNYSGTKNLTFKINPKNPTVTVKSAKKKATISYKKISGGVKYQIQYSTKKSSGFKNVKTNTTALKVTKSGLKSKKTYYFRVRAYKKVGKTTYYSGWVTKSVKIK